MLDSEKCIRRRELRTDPIHQLEKLAVCTARMEFLGRCGHINRYPHTVFSSQVSIVVVNVTDLGQRG